MIFVSFSIEKNSLLTVPPVSHLTHTSTKSNLYLANSLATVINESDIHRLLTVHVPNLMSLLHCLGHTKGSIQALGKCIHFVTRPVFKGTICLHLAPPPSWRTTPRRLSMTAYSIYLQLPSILEAIPTAKIWGHAMLCDRGKLIMAINISTCSNATDYRPQNLQLYLNA